MQGINLVQRVNGLCVLQKSDLISNRLNCKEKQNLKCVYKLSFFHGVFIAI